MNAVTIKLPPELDQELSQAAKARRIGKSELVRRALKTYLKDTTSDKGFVSALELAGDLVGSVRGTPRDLSTNPKYLDDYGR